MRILAIANQKGGCGKTTVAVNLASALAFQGRRVLLIDMDPQAHATTSLGIDPAEVKHNLYDVLTSSELNQAGLDTVIQRIDDNLYLAPSALFLSALEQELSGVQNREKQLLRAIQGMNQAYRYLVIDCPPSLGMLTFNSLAAAQEVLIPVEPSSYSLRGIDMLLESMELLEEDAICPDGIFTIANNLNRRTRFGREVVTELRERFGNRLLTTIIPPCTRIKEAAALGLPVDRMRGDNAAARAFKHLAREIVAMEEEERTRAIEAEVESILPSRQVEPGKVLFTLREEEARSVHVVGDFNDWTPSQEARLEPQGEGLFAARLQLEPGVYQYRFIVDGRWIEDPANPRTMPAPFGGRNSVLEIDEQDLTERRRQESVTS